jgi:hypothetical protein
MSAKEAIPISAGPDPGHIYDEGTLRWMFFAPDKSSSALKADIIVLADKSPDMDDINRPTGLARQFLDKGFEVVVVLGLKVGPENPAQTSIFFTTYNRTRLQESVRDLVSLCQRAKDFHTNETRRLILCGCGRSGLWSLLAAPAADAVIADCCQLQASDDQKLLDADLFCPGLRNIDTFEGAAILAAPHQMLFYNVAKEFPTASLRSGYHAAHADKNLRVEARSLNEDEIVASAVAIDQLIDSVPASTSAH